MCEPQCGEPDDCDSCLGIMVQSIPSLLLAPLFVSFLFGWISREMLWLSIPIFIFVLILLILVVVALFIGAAEGIFGIGLCCCIAAFPATICAIGLVNPNSLPFHSNFWLIASVVVTVVFVFMFIAAVFLLSLIAESSSSYDIERRGVALTIWVHCTLIGVTAIGVGHFKRELFMTYVGVGLVAFIPALGVLFSLCVGFAALCRWFYAAAWRRLAACPCWCGCCCHHYDKSELLLPTRDFNTYRSLSVVSQMVEEPESRMQPIRLDIDSLRCGLLTEPCFDVLVVKDEARTLQLREVLLEILDICNPHLCQQYKRSLTDGSLTVCHDSKHVLLAQLSGEMAQIRSELIGVSVAYDEESIRVEEELKLDDDEVVRVVSTRRIRLESHKFNLVCKPHCFTRFRELYSTRRDVFDQIHECAFTSCSHFKCKYESEHAVDLLGFAHRFAFIGNELPPELILTILEFLPMEHFCPNINADITFQTSEVRTDSALTDDFWRALQRHATEMVDFYLSQHSFYIVETRRVEVVVPTQEWSVNVCGGHRGDVNVTFTCELTGFENMDLQCHRKSLEVIQTWKIQDVGLISLPRMAIDIANSVASQSYLVGLWDIIRREQLDKTMCALC